MATTNELLHDALVRRQVYLSGYTQGLTKDIIGLLDATENEVRAALQDRLATFGAAEFGVTTNARLNTLVNVLAKIRASGFDGALSMWDDNLQALTVAEADFINSAFQDYSPVVLDTVVPDATMLAALVDIQPLQGRVLADWAASLAESDKQRIGAAIRLGMAQGEDSTAIVRRVIGTNSLDGADGATQATRANAASITNTAVSTMSSEARAAFYDANDDIISEEAYVATLDGKTTPFCQAHDGHIYKVGEGPMTPHHWNCRSIRVPVIDGKLIGNRPATSATDDALAGLSGKARRDAVAKLTGQVPAGTTYQDWLGRQTDAFQDHVLGPTRAALFRDGGLSLDSFVSTSGHEYTIDQLQAAEPDAFRRAGV